MEDTEKDHRASAANIHFNTLGTAGRVIHSDLLEHFAELKESSHTPALALRAQLGNASSRAA